MLVVGHQLALDPGGLVVHGHDQRRHGVEAGPEGGGQAPVPVQDHQARGRRVDVQVLEHAQGAHRAHQAVGDAQVAADVLPALQQGRVHEHARAGRQAAQRGAGLGLRQHPGPARGRGGRGGAGGGDPRLPQGADRVGGRRRRRRRPGHAHPAGPHQAVHHPPQGPHRQARGRRQIRLRDRHAVGVAGQGQQTGRDRARPRIPLTDHRTPGGRYRGCGRGCRGHEKTPSEEAEEVGVRDWARRRAAA